MTERLHWPRPLRRRSTRKKVSAKCRQALCAVLLLLTTALLVSNSAAPPSLTGDKWFTSATVQPEPRMKTPDSKHSSFVALSLQPAHVCSKQLVQLDDAQLPDPLTPLQQAALASFTPAVTKALSRALVPVPHAEMCPAVSKQQVLLVEHQRTLVLQPVLLPPSLLNLAAANSVQHRSSATTAADTSQPETIPTTAADTAAMPSLLDISKVHSTQQAADIVEDHAHLIPRLAGPGLCNSTCMCCLIGDLGQPVTPPTTLSFQAFQHHAVRSARADVASNQHDLSWLPIHVVGFPPTPLVLGACMLTLGCIVVGT